MERKRLDALPGSEDEYWKYSEVKLHEVATTKPCKHSFIHKTGQEVECKYCGVGYWLSKGWYVKEGILYTNKDEPVN